MRTLVWNGIFLYLESDVCFDPSLEYVLLCSTDDSVDWSEIYYHEILFVTPRITFLFHFIVFPGLISQETPFSLIGNFYHLHMNEPEFHRRKVSTELKELIFTIQPISQISGANLAIFAIFASNFHFEFLPLIFVNF